MFVTGYIEMGLDEENPVYECLYVTWHPSSTLVSTGNVSMDLAEDALIEGGDPTRVAFTSGDGYGVECEEGWYLLNMDWSTFHARALAMQAADRAALDGGAFIDSKNSRLNMAIGLGPIIVNFTVLHHYEQFHLVSDIHLFEEDWSTTLTVTYPDGTGNITDFAIYYHDFAGDSAFGGVFVPYPAYEPPTQLWIHRTAAPNPPFDDSRIFTLESNYYADMTEVGAEYPTDPILISRRFAMVSEFESDTMSGTFDPLPIVTTAAYWTGTGYTLPDIGA